MARRSLAPPRPSPAPDPTTEEDQVMGETLDAMLIRLRKAQGYSQLRVAEKLRELSGHHTVTRHEVSRWERAQRLPSDFWLRWLAQVLDAPLEELERGRASAKGADASPPTTPTPDPPPPGNPTAWAARPRTVVALTFEHRTTSIQFRAAYEKPEQATAAVDVFGQLVAAANGRSRHQPAEDRTRDGAGTPPPRRELPPGARPRVPAPATAALAATTPNGVPTGIRYTKGPGTPPAPTRNGVRP